jgi:phosphotransferase system enzyme I (PtsI)
MVRTLTKSRRRIFHGIAVSPGVGHGPVYIHTSQKLPIERRPIAPDAVEAEVARFNAAVEATREQLKRTQAMVLSKVDKAHAAIFEAQEVLLDDPLLIDTCRREIKTHHLNAEFVLEQVVEKIRSLLQEIDAPHLAAGNLDVLDVSSRIRENLVLAAGRGDVAPSIEKFSRDSILAAHNLRPSDTARLNAQHVLGIVTEAGGPTSHSAILAKALKIPAVVGIEGILAYLHPDDDLIVDGRAGTVIVQPTRQDLDRLALHVRKMASQQVSLGKLRDLACETRDGYSIDLGANLELPSEIEQVFEYGAKGVGLFRSEFFYIGRGYVPPEEEQFQVYRQVAERVAPHPVICRTLDMGGDKFMAQPGGMESEGMDSLLGLRAIRLCLAHPDMFRSQLRAILRASAFGNVKIMFPLITDVSEVRRAKKLLDEVHRDLSRAGIAHDAHMQVGIMVETPSAALTAHILAKEVDFFSIGTNDLIQYTMALDRVNESVADLYNPLHPSVIRLIRATIDAAHKAGIWVGLCGEMGADPAMAVLLIGLGIDELSMSGVAVPEVKRLIRSLTLEEVRKFRQDILADLETGDPGKVLAQFRRKHRLQART